MSKHLHIVAFDVPFPPDYGGAIDIFYKLKALHAAGINITLHCFEYGRGEKKELKQYCSEVHYYRRKTGKHLLFSSLPYIVATRSSDELMASLLKDNDPILFEGLHCCCHLGDLRLKNRKKIVRMHNIEHHYYASLAQVEKKFFRRKYFESEAGKLERFESVLNYADAIAAISPADTEELTRRYRQVTNIMAFHPHDAVSIKEGKGNFALYHGSLAVGENNKAALYLINEVLNDLDAPFIIAGNGASAELREAVKGKAHIQLRENISTGQIYELVQNAQVNVLPTFQNTGIKLKLLAALYGGRHCLVNSPMVQRTGLEPLCHIADSAEEMRKELKRLMDAPFDQQEKSKREKVLLGKFSNRVNAGKLLDLIYG